MYLGVDLSLSSRGCTPTPDSQRVSVAQAQHPCWAPCPCLCLRLGSCLTRGIHTARKKCPCTVASMILTNGESTYSHCHLAHIFQLTFSDYQEICIIHALPAPHTENCRALSCSPTCTKPAAHAHQIPSLLFVK